MPGGADTSPIMRKDIKRLIQKHIVRSIFIIVVPIHEKKVISLNMSTILDNSNPTLPHEQTL